MFVQAPDVSRVSRAPCPWHMRKTTQEVSSTRLLDRDAEIKSSFSGSCHSIEKGRPEVGAGPAFVARRHLSPSRADPTDDV
jgi:hypothetical protein